MACNPNNSYVADAGDRYEVVINGSKVEDVWYNESNREAALWQAENDFNAYCEAAGNGGGGGNGGNPYAGVIAHVVYAGGGLCQFVLTYPDGRNVSNSPTDCFDAQGLYFWAIAHGATLGRFEAPPLYEPAPVPVPVPVPGGQQPAPVYQPVQLPAPVASVIASVERFLGVGGGSPAAGTVVTAGAAGKASSMVPVLLVIAGVVVLIMMKR